MHQCVKDGVITFNEALIDYTATKYQPGLQTLKLTLPTGSPEWTTRYEGKTCGGLSFFKIEDFKPMEMYNKYIEESTD